MSHPFFGQPFDFTQPDGSTIQVLGWGDQQQAVFQAADGRILRKDPASGAFIPEDPPAAPVVNPRDMGGSERLRVPPRARRSFASFEATVGRSQGLPILGTRWQQRREERQLTLARGLRSAPPQRQTVGRFVGLCLLIDFPDVRGTIAREEVDAFCNRSGYTGFGNQGSVGDYFQDVSGGLVDYTNLVMPYYTARRQRSYYTDRTVDQPLRAVELIVEALDDLIRRRVDLSPLSTDSRGFVYAVNVFYAGRRVNNWGEGLWPHAYHLPSPFGLRRDARAHDYQITDMGQELSLGTFCHENGHMLCDFPDLYDYGGESAGVGGYCLMCAGGSIAPKNPVHVGAYLKAAAGWASDLAPLDPGQVIELPAAGNRFALLRRSQTEYLILENRHQAARDAALPDSGLAIWHVDELGNNSHEQQSPTRHYECTLIQADARLHLERNVNLGDGQDLFHAGHNDTFGPRTQPAGRWWDGTEVPIEVFGIGPAGPAIRFSVR